MDHGGHVRRDRYVGSVNCALHRSSLLQTARAAKQASNKADPLSYPDTRQVSRVVK